MQSTTDICLKEICKQLRDLNHTMGEIYKVLKSSKNDTEGDDLK